MELASFDPQLSNEQLAELGRMTVNFGYAELLLDWILLAALNVRNQEAIRVLISPLATRRKIELLEAELPKCTDKAAAKLIGTATARLEKANNDRNQIIHGYWAHRNGVGVIAYYRKDPPKSRVVPTSVANIADSVAVATRELYEAYNLLNSKPLNLSSPHILCPNDDGSFSVIVPATLSA